ncbi:TerD family protein [Pseudomonas syringae]|nr:TerD family protein [Pseudomonas syringae]MBD8802871.1 TerD family protein [Pseudomonas syringae]MBD8813583.1 TerD family protein [Pseudomonas syringae]
MSQSLKPGENTTLDQSSGQVVVTHAVDARLDVNLTAFLVTDSGKVVDDSGMVFFNAPVHASGAATFSDPVTADGAVSHRIQFDLARLPAGISKIAITLTQDGGSAGFAEVRGLQAQVTAGAQVLELAPGAFSAETGIIVLELYVRNAQVKARSVWQGFASGLAGLCGLYGIDVEEPAATAEPAPAAAPVSAPAPAVNLTKTVITLDKPGATHKVTLDKSPGAPRAIRVTASWVDNGDGEDNDDLDLRIGILRPDGQMSIIQAPEKPGDFNRYPFVFHTGDVIQASASQPAQESVDINPDISRQLGGKVALVCSVYSAVSNGDVAVASLKPSMRMEYGNQVVECALEVVERKKGFFSRKVTFDPSYTYVIGLIEIDQDHITLSPSGVMAEAGSEATPWLSWNDGAVLLTMDGPAVFKQDDDDDDDYDYGRDELGRKYI